MPKLTYAHLDYDDIKVKYPLCVREIIKWFANREDIVQGLGAMEGEGGKYQNNPKELFTVLGNIVPAIIANDPRKLYEFFDDKACYISIAHSGDDNGEPLFTYLNSITKTSKVVASRGVAEYEALMDAFAILEERVKAKLA